MNPSKVNFAEIFEQWLNAEESCRSWHTTKVVNPGNTVTPVLNRHPEPNIGRNGMLCGEVRDTLRPLCKDLERVPFSRSHRREHAINERIGDLRMEQVTH